MGTKKLKDIHFAHLYFAELKLKTLEKFKNNFSTYTSYDVTDGSFDATLYDIIFIEIDKLNKQSFKTLNDIVKQNPSKCIHILATDYKNSVLLKFIIHFSLNESLPLKDDENEVTKILYNAVEKYTQEKKKKDKFEIDKEVNSFFSFLAFKKDTLIFANEKSKKLFSSENLSEIESLVKNNPDITSLLTSSTDEIKEVTMQNSEGTEQTYNFYLHQSEESEKKIIGIIPHNNVVQRKDSLFATINRFRFIEILKDKLAQNSIDKSNMSLIFINIKNYDKLIKSFSTIVIYDVIKLFIEKLSFQKEKYQELIQWNPNFFILIVERDNFEAVKIKLDSMHQNLIYIEFDKKISPIIISSALHINNLDLNDTINIIEQIEDYSFKSSDYSENEYFELNHLNEYLDDSQQIKHYLKSCFNNQTPVKLLNIYKGLCINSQSKIIKISEDSYFVQCENLQGYSMQFESKTVLQAPDLPKDIQANISYVNIEKSYAVLDQLTFLNFSANNRQNTRVQPNIRTPVLIKYNKNTFSGEILDISTLAIAIQTNGAINDELLFKKVLVQFKLPDTAEEDGFSTMLTDGTVTHLAKIGDTKSKVIVTMDIKKPFDAYILKYMYNRQKELILELKKATRFSK